VLLYFSITATEYKPICSYNKLIIINFDTLWVHQMFCIVVNILAVFL
jgi:hypothetical protein